jgi:hypothetical protein
MYLFHQQSYLRQCIQIYTYETGRRVSPNQHPKCCYSTGVDEAVFNMYTIYVGCVTFDNLSVPPGGQYWAHVVPIPTVNGHYIVMVKANSVIIVWQEAGKYTDVSST